MRILFICQFFAPDITAAAFRMSDFARLLAEAGDEVCVITSNPHKALVTADLDDTPFEAAGIRVLRSPIRDVVGTGARAYLRHYLSFLKGSLQLGWRVWREGWKPDVIYASSPPLFVGISGRLLSLLFRRPLVFEVRDIWPDAAVSAGQLREGGRAYRIGKLLENYLYRKADHITCVAKRMSDYLQRRTRTPVTVVYNGISLDPAVLLDAGVSPLRENAQTNGPLPVTRNLRGSTSVVVPSDGDERRTFLYAGNLGHVQQLDLLLHAWSQLIASGELAEWKIELLGAGAQLDNLRRLCQQLKLQDHVVFSPAVERFEAAERMQRADVLYLHLMSDATMEKTIPSKLFDYLLAGRPILGGLAGEGAEILEETGANITFPPGDQNALQKALLDVVRRWPELCDQAHANRDLVLARFTRQQAADVLRAVFQRLASA
jgi:glycosyltransferase involved in cell wall biosynthesis